MKKQLTLISFLTIGLLYPTIGQEFNPLTSSIDKRPLETEIIRDIAYQASGFNCNCTTDFWTVNFYGIIQQWSLKNHIISGGDSVLAEAPTSIAYCGDPDSTTFYGGSSANTGILYYDSLAGWAEIPTPIQLYNNGGYVDYQYYMSNGNTNPLTSVLYSLNGNEVFLIDSLVDLQFTVADIAVDSLGQAWTFVGELWDSTTSIYVYNYSGLVKSYNIRFNSRHGYGSTFINDTLYIGFGPTNTFYPGKLVPVILDNNNAYLGPAISFPYAMYDLASCSCIRPDVSIEELHNDSYILVFPNPATSIITISNLEVPASYRILNLTGSMMHEGEVISNRINIEALPSGIYLVEISTKDFITSRKLIKK